MADKRRQLGDEMSSCKTVILFKSRMILEVRDDCNLRSLLPETGSEHDNTETKGGDRNNEK